MDELHADDVGRWIALSERFASEGEMNLSKLLDAAVYADVRRSGWNHRPATARATMEGELRTSIERLKARHADAGLIGALELGSAKLARGDHRDMLVEEAPDVFVCRACGHVALGEPPAHCPECR